MPAVAMPADDATGSARTGWSPWSLRLSQPRSSPLSTSAFTVGLVSSASASMESALSFRWANSVRSLLLTERTEAFPSPFAPNSAANSFRRTEPLTFPPMTRTLPLCSSTVTVMSQ